jgi:hypothetical protein
MLNLRQYIGHTLSNGAPRYYIAMHDLYTDPKTGRQDLMLAPSQSQKEYSTPAGVFAYPLNERILSDFMTLNLEYREKASHVVLYEATDPQHMLWIKEAHSREARLLEQIRDKAIDGIAAKHKSDRYITYIQMYRKMILDQGFTSVLDFARTLHITHQEQIVFLTQKAYRVVGSAEAYKVRRALRPKKSTVDLSLIEKHVLQQIRALITDPKTNWDSKATQDKIRDIDNTGNIFLLAQGAGAIEITGPKVNLEQELQRFGARAEGEFAVGTFGLCSPNIREELNVSLTTCDYINPTYMLFDNIRLLRIRGPVLANISVYDSNVILDLSQTYSIRLDSLVFDGCKVRIIQPRQDVVDKLSQSANTVIVDKIRLRPDINQV